MAYPRMRNAECGMRNEEREIRRQFPASDPLTRTAGLVFHSAFRIPHSAFGLLAFLVLLQLDDDFLVVHLDGLLDHADLLGEVRLERNLHAVGVEVVAAG